MLMARFQTTTCLGVKVERPWRDRMWNGLEMEIQHVLPNRMYVRLRKNWQERQKGGEA